MNGRRLARAKGLAALLVVCVCLAVLHTWPLAAAPHRYSRVDNGDFLLNAWAIAWVAHQAPRDPVHLFDGNIFWPERRTLAYSEAMIVQGVMATPLIALGASPVLAFNLVMLAGFSLTAFAFGWLALRWTGSWTAAYVAASAAGFNAHLFTRLAHLQAMHVEFIAVVLLGMDLVFTRQRVRDAFLLGAGFALQGLTSVYLMVFTTWATIFAAAARWLTTVSGTRRRAAGLLTLAGMVAAVLLSPYLLAYVRVNREQAFARVVADNRAFAGSYTDYLSTVSHVHYWWSRPFVDVSASINFPGITVFLLALVALARRATRRDPRVIMTASVAVGCGLASMAARLPGYEHIHAVVPLFWAVRVQAHMGQVVLLALAILAGFGAWQVAERVGARRLAWLPAALLVVLINAESLRAPIPWRVFDGIPRIYDRLAAERAAVVVELPAYDRRAVFANAPYVFNSTRYWHPLVNGYSGFTPGSFNTAAAVLRSFPDLPALEMLRQRSVTHIVIHEGAFAGLHGPDSLERVGRTGSLQLLAREGDISLYRFR